jgi:glucose/arabinose dehydrogenase
VTTLIDNLSAPWSLAFLPNRKILLTERLPGSIRILDTKTMMEIEAPLLWASINRNTWRESTKHLGS